MGRIRTIKPEFWIHEELSSLSAETHMLAAGLLNYADDFGFFNPHPALIKAAVFPLRETFSPVPVMVEQLVAIGYIRIGTTKDGKKVGEVRNFLSHQRVSHPTKSRYSDSGIDWESSGIIREDSVKAPETFRPEGNGKEGNRKELKPSPRQARSDSRHVPFKLAVQTYQTFKGATFTWDESEAKQLSLLLKAVPTLTLAVFQHCLNHRARSPGTPHGERPRMWLPNILKYQEAPLNEFGKTGASNGNRNQSKTGGNLDAAAQAIAFLEQADRDSQAANEIQPESEGSYQPGDAGTGRGRLIDLRSE